MGLAVMNDVSLRRTDVLILIGSPDRSKLFLMSLNVRMQNSVHLCTFFGCVGHINK
jgi:hypothetical protein